MSDRVGLFGNWRVVSHRRHRSICRYWSPLSLSNKPQKPLVWLSCSYFIFYCFSFSFSVFVSGADVFLFFFCFGSFSFSSIWNGRTNEWICFQISPFLLPPSFVISQRKGKQQTNSRNSTHVRLSSGWLCAVWCWLCMPPSVTALGRSGDVW